MNSGNVKIFAVDPRMARIVPGMFPRAFELMAFLSELKLKLKLKLFFDDGDDEEFVFTLRLRFLVFI